MWRGCVEPSGLKDWSCAFIFQGHGCNPRPTQVSRKTESTREGKGGGEVKGRERRRWEDRRKETPIAAINALYSDTAISILRHN